MKMTFITFLRCTNCYGNYTHIGIPEPGYRLGCPHCPEVQKVKCGFRIEGFHDVAAEAWEVETIWEPEDYPDHAIFTGRQRQRILYRLLKGKSRRKVADAMGVKRNTVVKHASNARHRFQEYLDGTDDDLDQNGASDLKAEMLEDYQRKFA